MKKYPLIIGWLLLLALNARGQGLSYSYNYDAAGNRTTTVVFDLKAGGGDLDNAAPTPLTDLRSDGESILVYPNPTHGTVTIERQEGRTIGDYRLNDASGRTLERGKPHDAGPLGTRQRGLSVRVQRRAENHPLQNHQTIIPP